MGHGLARFLGARWSRAFQSKWGRHCCRPHSHQCVAVFLQPKFKGRRLGIRCFPFRSVRRLPFQFCHRRSHRHPDLPSTRPGFGRVAIRGSFAYLAQPRFNGRFRSLTLPLMAGASNGHIAFRSEDLYTTPPSAFGRFGPAHVRKPSHFRHRPTLRPAEAFCTRVSKSAWTDPVASFRL